MEHDFVVPCIYFVYPGTEKGVGQKELTGGLLLNPNGELACSLSLLLFGAPPMEQNGSLDGACKRSLTDGPTAEDDWFVSAPMLRKTFRGSFTSSGSFCSL